MNEGNQTLLVITLRIYVYHTPIINRYFWYCLLFDAYRCCYACIFAKLRIFVLFFVLVSRYNKQFLSVLQKLLLCYRQADNATVAQICALCFILHAVFLSSFSITESVEPLLAVEEIKFTRELQDVKLTSANVAATFECELSKAGLKVEWMKADKRLRRDEKYDMVSEGKTHRLVIEKAGSEDVGKYAAVYEKLTTTAALSVVSE